MLGAWRGCGTMRRGAGFCGGGGAAAGFCATGLAGGAAGLAAGGATATEGGAGGRAATAVSCSLRSWIALSTSPGLETRDQSIFGRGSSCFGAEDDAPPRLPRLIMARTRSASSGSIELECVFFSVTPISFSASKIALLLTSSSRARSLIRTLLIRPLSLPTVSPRTQIVIHNLSNAGSSLSIIPGITWNCALISGTQSFRCNGSGALCPLLPVGF